MITTDNDYSYIGVFIGFLERIINIIKGLLKDLGFGAATGEPAAEA